MSPETIFSICSALAMLGWVILILLPMWKARDSYVISIIVILFAIIYLWLIVSGFDPGMFDNFNSLSGVAELFSDKRLLLAGWVHYLAFDLLAGTWIISNARRNGINHWLTVPALFLTFMLGPIGFLLYFVVRWIKTKKFVVETL